MRRPPEDPAIVPFPTYPVSNMEWVPKPITRRQALAERMIAEECAERAKRHGMTRAQFLRTAAATATAFMVLNRLSGSSAFAVKREHCDDLDAARELLDRKPFVMDVQQHHVDLNLYSSFACAFRFPFPPGNRESAGGCPGNVGQQNFIKEVFVDSETDVGVISGLPSGTPLGPVGMAETRDLVNELAGSERCLAQAVCDPRNPPGSATSIESLDAQVARGVRALKCYTYSGNWRLDDLRPDGSAEPQPVAYRMLEKAQGLGLRLVNVHKGLPAEFAPMSEEYVRTTDFPKVVHDWPRLSFCAYHSGYFTSASDHPEGKQGLTEFLEVVESIPRKERRRVYAEIGSTFAIQVILMSSNPDAPAHFIGRLLKALGSRNILWGTDSIWWGSPQWLIDAFKVLTIPERLQEQEGYPPLTEKAKRRIFGQNAARLYGIKPKDERCAIPADRLASWQAEQGGARAGRRLVSYGPQTRRDFFAMLRAERRAVS